MLRREHYKFISLLLGFILLITWYAYFLLFPKTVELGFELVVERVTLVYESKNLIQLSRGVKAEEIYLEGFNQISFPNKEGLVINDTIFVRCDEKNEIGEHIFLNNSELNSLNFDSAKLSVSSTEVGELLLDIAASNVFTSFNLGKKNSFLELETTKNQSNSCLSLDLNSPLLRISLPDKYSDRRFNFFSDQQTGRYSIAFYSSGERQSSYTIFEGFDVNSLFFYKKLNSNIVSSIRSGIFRINKHEFKLSEKDFFYFKASGNIKVNSISSSNNGILISGRCNASEVYRGNDLEKVSKNNLVRSYSNYSEKPTLALSILAIIILIVFYLVTPKKLRLKLIKSIQSVLDFFKIPLKLPEL